MVLARSVGESVCKELSIMYRGLIDRRAVFLITKDGVVVMQFRVDEAFLSRKGIFFEKWLDTDKIRSQIRKQNLEYPTLLMIQDLYHGMKKVTFTAKVVEKQKPQLIHTQYGSSFMLTNATLSDSTGKVRLCLWGAQSTSVKVGNTIQVMNASVRTYKGEKQIHIGRTGTLTIIEQVTPKQPNNTIHQTI